LIELEHHQFGWADQIKKIEAPVLMISVDADIATLDHTLEFFGYLGAGVMGDMGEPLPPARLAILPASSHTDVIAQVELLHGVIEPFLNNETPGSGLFP